MGMDQISKNEDPMSLIMRQFYANIPKIGSTFLWLGVPGKARFAVANRALLFPILIKRRSIFSLLSSA
jgi:hypothetical protein